MASAYSQPRQYSGYLEEYNKEFLAAAMGAKQGAYNIGRAQAQEAYNQYSNLDLLKDEDKAYFKDNLYQLNEQVKMAGMGDLSQAGVVSNLTSYYSKAMDENVLNAYAGTKTIRKIQAEAEASKKDGKYNDLNYSYSMDAANKWASDGKVGSKYEGNSTYVPYTNIVEIATKQIKDLVPNGYVRLNPTGNGLSYYKENGEEVTESRILQLLDATMMTDPNVSQQIGVNAWGAYGKLADNDFVNLVQTSYSDKVSQYDAEIKKQRQSLLGAKGENRTNIEETIAYLEKNKKQYTDVDKNSAESILKSRVGLERQFYTNDFLSGIAKAYAYNSVKDKGFVADPGAVAIYKEKKADDRAKARMEFDAAQDAQKNLLTIIDAKDPFATGNVLGYSKAQVTALLTPSVEFAAGVLDTPQLENEFAQKKLLEDRNVAQKKVDDIEATISAFFTKGAKIDYGLTEGKALELPEADLQAGLDKATFNALLKDKKVIGTWEAYQSAQLQRASALEKATVTNKRYELVKSKIDKGIALDKNINTSIKNVLLGYIPEEKNKFSIGKIPSGLTTNISIERRGSDFVVKRVKNEGSYKEGTKGFIVDKNTENLVFKTEEDLEDYLKTVHPVGKQISDQLYSQAFKDYFKGITPVEFTSDTEGERVFIRSMLDQLATTDIDLDVFRTPVKDKNGLKIDAKGNPIYNYDGVTVNVDENGSVKVSKAETTPLIISTNKFTGSVGNKLQVAAETLRAKQDFKILEEDYMESVEPGTSKYIEQKTVDIHRGVTEGGKVVTVQKVFLFRNSGNTKGVLPQLRIVDEAGNTIETKGLTLDAVSLEQAELKLQEINKFNLNSYIQ